MNEVHGVKPQHAQSPRVVVVEGSETVHLDLGACTGAYLTPDEARHLASKLVRLANRIAAKRAAP